MNNNQLIPPEALLSPHQGPTFVNKPSRIATGSTLGRFLLIETIQQILDDARASQWVTPTFEEIEVSGFLCSPEPPRYSAAYLARLVQILFERDVKIARLEQALLVAP